MKETIQTKSRMERYFFAISTCLLTWGCIPAAPVEPVDGPEPPTDLLAIASTQTPAVFEGMTATCTANAIGGTPPYRYRWDQNSGPENVDIGVETVSTITTEALTDPGQYVFRVVVTDGAGFHDSDFVVIEVQSTVTASAPAFAIIGEPTQLSANIDIDVNGVTTLWEVTQGSATFDDATQLSPMLTTTTGETVGVRFTATIPAGDLEPVRSVRDFEIVSVLDLQPQVVIETNFGDITLELDGTAAPKHMVNFLLYVDDGFYDGLVFHRNACSQPDPEGPCEPFVLQGGGYERVDGELILLEPTRDPVEAEADNGLSNGTLYSVALALTGGDPDSGTTQFYINLDDNSFLDDQDFTVFAQVVDGTDVVDAIVATPTTESPFLPGEDSLPTDDITLIRVLRSPEDAGE